MSDENAQMPMAPPPRPTSPTPSEKSDRSTASSKLPRPSGIKPPSAVIKAGPSATSTETTTPNTPRIGRFCMSHGHDVKAGPPPLEFNKCKFSFILSANLGIMIK